MKIEVKNDAMLGRMNDGVIATKLYSLEKAIEEKNKEIERLNNIIKEVRKIINIFKNEDWYENYEYNDLEYALKYILKILDKVGSDKE